MADDESQARKARAARRAKKRAARAERAGASAPAAELASEPEAEADRDDELEAPAADEPAKPAARDEDDDEDDEDDDDEERAKKPVAAAPAADAWRPPYGFLLATTAIGVVADLGTKYFAKSRLEVKTPPYNGEITVVDGLFKIIFAKNKGGAFGFLADQEEVIRKGFFFLISVGAIAFILSLYRKLTREQIALRWGLPLVLSGALGNLVDRIRYGYVVDFLDFFATIGGRERHWPTFNVADIAIVAGVILIGLDMFGKPAEVVLPGPAPMPAKAPPSKPVARKAGVASTKRGSRT